MSGIFQNLIALFGLLVIGALGWYLFFDDSRTPPDTSVTSDSIQAQVNMFIEQQGLLRSITIDPEVTANPAWQRLEPVSGPIPPQRSGRSNPFIY